MTGNYFWFNDNLMEAGNWDEAQTETGTVVYEVLRIVEGVPLFFDDHFQRLINSCKLLGKPYKPDKEKMLAQFIELAKINDLNIGNVTLKLIFRDVNNQATKNVSLLVSPTVILYFIPHSYPAEMQYRDGVTVGFLDAERGNPEAKVIQGLREKANQLIKSENLYEVLLVNREGLITEGSKSNMVFVKGTTLYTCPLNKVLTGITLKKVIEIATRINIPVLFEAVPRIGITGYDALFITGTSPKILPVAHAGEFRFDPQNTLVRQLMKEYDLLLEQDIKIRKLNSKYNQYYP